ncbi:malto-oligosyltrehalose trehalohydrolase [Candidatus Thiosymbion oneisti]|uniref:malto-oligosyltrehalose trehalohydrolase n=1 Tax=Candidatus Thiosymbion oneisti TaxID=589554 RepID=UPI000ABEC663|nr:malto-oligosyltrehalose trehalohydrolase [Candidatus Thiosymbion oneisti]
MHSVHPMPFGAQVQADGRVRFRLWAPAATRVELCLEEDTGESILPLIGEPGGWFGLVTDRATAGSRYRYCIDGGLRVPDPASRFQPDDVHGPSQVIDPRSWRWTDADWYGRPWEEAVVYELHVGAFSPQGSFAAVTRCLDYLAELGVTAIELMPIADFHGARNWGYDGVLPFAPDSSYGRPEDLKALIQSAHRKGLMVLLDVVYNHFGPEGNFLHQYAPQFFTARHHTPWGTAINFDGPGSETVRRFFIHNALYWLEEYRFDGLRLDAVDAIRDDSTPDFLAELAATVRQGPGRERHVHPILENDDNAAHYLLRDRNGRPRQYTAQWNDDLQHALHILLTGEADGCYGDFKDRPVWYLGRCLAQGFGYQGEPSAYCGGAKRGEPSRALPPVAFVSFLQNHDQAGNRPFGERIHCLTDPERLRAAIALVLLAPAPPLLFMGEEFAAAQPFQFFCDFGPELAAAVAAGRRRGFACFEGFAQRLEHRAPPDPNDPNTFDRSKLDWGCLNGAPHADWLGFYRNLLTLRHNQIIPRLAGMEGNAGDFRQIKEQGLRIVWCLGDGSILTLLANLDASSLPVTATDLPVGKPLYTYPPGLTIDSATDRLPPWCVVWFLQTALP